MHAKGDENKPGDEKVVCVRLFQIFSSGPRLFFLFFLSSMPSSLSLPVFCSFFFPTLQMLYVKNWKQRPKEMMSWCGWWCCCGCSSSSLVLLLLPFLLVCADAGAVGGVAAAAFPPRLCRCWCGWWCCRGCSSFRCGCCCWDGGDDEVVGSAGAAPGVAAAALLLVLLLLLVWRRWWGCWQRWCGSWCCCCCSSSWCGCWFGCRRCGANRGENLCFTAFETWRKPSFFSSLVLFFFSMPTLSALYSSLRLLLPLLEEEESSLLYMPEPETTLTFFHLHRLCLGKQSQSLDDDEGVGNVWQRRLFRVQGRNGRERGMAKGGNWFWVFYLSRSKTELSPFPPKEPTLPSLLFSKKLSPLLSFVFFSPVQKPKPLFLPFFSFPFNSQNLSVILFSLPPVFYSSVHNWTPPLFSRFFSFFFSSLFSLFFLPYCLLFTTALLPPPSKKKTW